MMADVYYIISEHYQNLCLEHADATTKGSHVTVNEFTGLARQQWWIDESKNTIISMFSSLALDIKTGNGVRQGHNIITWDVHGGRNQVWTYEPTSRMVLCPGYNLVLDVASGNFFPGASVIAWSPNGQPQQHWLIVNARSLQVEYCPTHPAPPLASAQPYAPTPSYVPISPYALAYPYAPTEPYSQPYVQSPPGYSAYPPGWIPSESSENWSESAPILSDLSNGWSGLV
jgi:hypothetical protein